VLSRGHLFQKSPKGHPELAGGGVEYCWGKSKIHFRRSKKDRKGKNLEALIRESVSASNLKLSTVRKFARKAADMRRIYKKYKNNEKMNLADYEVVERLYKICKAHRSALDQFTSFINKTI